MPTFCAFSRGSVSDLGLAATFNGLFKSGSDDVDVVEMTEARLAKEGTREEILSIVSSVREKSQDARG